MLAIFKTGGKQYAVKAGQILKVEKLNGNKGDKISFNDILAVSDLSNHSIGNPLVKDASVQAIILDQIRDKKIIIFKKRQRQNYRHTQGHRQYLTVLQIELITIGDKKSSISSKKLPGKKVVEKKEVKEVIVKTSSTKKKTAPKKKSTVKKTAVKKKVAPKKGTKK